MPAAPRPEAAAAPQTVPPAQLAGETGRPAEPASTPEALPPEALPREALSPEALSPVVPPSPSPVAAPASPAVLPPMVPVTPPGDEPQAPQETEKPVEPAALPPPTVAVTPTAPAVPPLVLPEGAQAELEAAAQAVDDVFSQSSDALAGLTSYRYTTVFSFVGEDDGEAKSGSVEVRGAVAGPDRQNVTWKDLETGEQFGMLRVGDLAWVLDGEEWQSVPAAVADVMADIVLVFGPAMSWGELVDDVRSTAAYVGTETVNGIAARHYASTYGGWSEEWKGEISAATGDVWIAEAGYPVRYRFAADGVDENGNRGSMLWTMELTDVNAPVTVDAPEANGDSGG